MRLECLVLLALCAGLGCVSSNNNGQCEGSTSVWPAARSETMSIFDPDGRRVVFFGGDDGPPINCNPAPHAVGELWVYHADCGTFELKTTAGEGPGARARGMAAYDSKRHRMLVFGGRFRAASTGPYQIFNDVWALDLNTFVWSELSTTGPPPEPRSNPAGGYDEVADRLLVFGGNTSTDGAFFQPVGDLWELDLENLSWAPILNGGAPPARLQHTATIDPTGRRMFIYGGTASFFGPFVGDLWALNLENDTWSLLHPGPDGGVPPFPDGRIGSTLAFDAASDRPILFGGHDFGAVGNNNDTWFFNLQNNRWEEVVPPEIANNDGSFCLFPPDFTIPNLSAPERRSAQLAAFDEEEGQWILFGGKTDCGIIDDLWRFDAASGVWTEERASTTGETCARTQGIPNCADMCTPL